MLIHRKRLPHIQTADTLIQRVLIIWVVKQHWHMHVRDTLSQMVTVQEDVIKWN